MNHGNVKDFIAQMTTNKVNSNHKINWPLTKIYALNLRFFSSSFTLFIFFPSWIITNVPLINNLKSGWVQYNKAKLSERTSLEHVWPKKKCRTNKNLGQCTTDLQLEKQHDKEIIKLTKTYALHFKIFTQGLIRHSSASSFINLILYKNKEVLIKID